MDFSSFFQYQFFLPVFFFVLWGIVSWGWPVVSVALLPLFFPFYFGVMKFSIFGVPFTVVEWMVYVTFGVFVIRSFFSQFKRQRDQRSSFFIPIAFIFSGLFLGLFQAENSKDVFSILGIIKGWFVVPILYFFLMQKILPSCRSVRRCFEWYSISAFSLALFGIIQYIFHFTTTPDGRVSGPFESANYLAFYIVPALVFVLIRLWHLFFIQHEYHGLAGVFRRLFHVEERYSPVAVVWHILLAATMLVTLYLTRSFGAELALFLAFFGYALYHLFFSHWKLGRSRAFFNVSVVFLILTIFVSVFFVTADPGKFRQMFNVSSQSSSSVRLEVWKVSLNFLVQHPILGVGAGRFQDKYSREAKVSSARSLMKVPCSTRTIFFSCSGSLQDSSVSSVFCGSAFFYFTMFSVFPAMMERNASHSFLL